jgi:hypothetical protein
VSWTVRVVAPGTHRIAVHSSTGSARAKTITLSGSGIFD